MSLQSQCLIINAILWTSRGRCYFFSADLHRWRDRPLGHELRFLATFLWSQKGHLDISNYHRANRYSRFLISFWPILNLMQHNHTLNNGGPWDTLAYSNANKSLLKLSFHPSDTRNVQYIWKLLKYDTLNHIMEVTCFFDQALVICMQCCNLA